MTRLMSMDDERSALKELAKVARQMAEGHLDVSAPDVENGELAELASAMNDLAVNMQEVLINMWKQAEIAKSVLKETSLALTSHFPEGLPEDIRKGIDSLRGNFSDTQGAVMAFDLYDVFLDPDGTCSQYSGGET